ncbi:MAG: hypothetical protein GX100_01145 [candidate division WS1 bacterium]|nr:hypothetical protein [candidate division WS1 bacterium]
MGGLQIQETSDQNGLGSGAPLKLLILTNGLESAFEFYNWCRYTGNESLLRDKVYPYMKEAVQFFLEYAKRGEDGKWHIYPANARETWLKVQDAAPDLYGLRACLPILLRESQRLGRDAELIPVWQEFLDNLAAYPADPETGAYVPCVFRPDSPETGLPVVDRMYGKPQNVSHDATERKNSEVPECEIMYPWNLAGIDSPNYHQAKLTFTMRKSWPVGWDPSGIWAARLGLADEALRALLIHGGNQRWPQGWWITPGGAYWGKAVPATPGFDSAGVNATTLTEMCLQSYDGRVRLWPAFPREWSGLLRLRALPGFMVTSEITRGRVRYAVIESERGEECRLINPWEGKLRVTSSQGKSWESGEREVTFATERGGRYVIEPVDAPLREAVVAELKPAVNQGPRWPGQVSPDQAWRKEQPIMVGMAQDGHPLRVRAEAAAAAAAAQQ